MSFKLIAFRINQPRGVDPAIYILGVTGFTGVTSPEIGRLIFEFDSELPNDEYVNAAALQRPVYEKPGDAVEVRFEEVSRSTTGFELRLEKVEDGTPYDSPLVYVVTVDSPAVA